jgi:hypothetical protein
MSLISGNATFGADAINCSSSSILGAAAFIDTASNQGTVSVASFSDTAVNEGTAVSAVFNDGAVNVGSLTSGTFLGTAVNSGVVNVAEFFGTASNVGVIVEAAKFADTSSNVGTVSGSAIFADTSISDGVVIGAVQLGVNVTEGENQALTETPTEYTQADGFFPNAHYSSGVKAAPADYATVVHQVGGFWYKYDGNGDGSLASGNYSDGISMFTFVNGIKGAAYTPSYNVLGSYYYVGTLTSGTTVLYTDNALTTLASDITPFVEAGIAKYSTDNSGVVTIENIGVIDANYYYAGTLTSGTTVLYTDNALTTLALNITPFVVAGDARYSTNGSGVVTIENISTTTIGGTTYYYTGTLTSGTTVLYSDNGLDTLATATTYVDENADIYYEIDANGVYSETAISTTTIGGTTYYYTGTLTSGTTVLYSDNALDTLATATTYVDENADIYYEIDANGVYSSQTINTINDASSVTYYHIGTFGVGTILYTDNALDSLAYNLVSCNFGDLSSPPDGFNDLVSTDINGYVCQIEYGTE